MQRRRHHEYALNSILLQIQGAKEYAENHQTQIQSQETDITESFANATQNIEHTKLLAMMIHQRFYKLPNHVRSQSFEVAKLDQQTQTTANFITKSQEDTQKRSQKLKKWEKIHRCTKPLAFTYPFTKFVVAWHDVREDNALSREQMATQDWIAFHNTLKSAEEEFSTLKATAEQVKELTGETQTLRTDLERIKKGSLSLALSAGCLVNFASALLRLVSDAQVKLRSVNNERELSVRQEEPGILISSTTNDLTNESLLPNIGSL